MKTLSEVQREVGATCICPFCGEPIAIITKQIPDRELICNIIDYLDTIVEGTDPIGWCPNCRVSFGNDLTWGANWCL